MLFVYEIHAVSAACGSELRFDSRIPYPTLFVTYPLHYRAQAILSDALVTHLSRSGWMEGAKVDLPVRAAQTPAHLAAGTKAK